MCTWRSQDDCALSRHCEPCKQSSWSRASKLAGEQASPHSKWYGHPKSHLDHCCCMRKRPWICTPSNARYPITAGWTGGADRRQMEKMPELGLNFRTSGPEPRTQPLHYTDTHTCTHTHTHTHTYTHTHTHIQTHTHTHTHTHTLFTSEAIGVVVL